MTTATIYRPRMISIPESPYCELARWVLDRLRIPAVEECHAPRFHARATQRYGEGGAASVYAVPVLDTGEVALLDARAVVDYYELRARVDQMLFPADSAARADARELFDFFFDTFGVATRAWAYTYLLPARSITTRLWGDRAPWWERLGARMFYSSIAAFVRRTLALQPDTLGREQRIIEAALERVAARLADGRRFLMGETFTAPDLALAALAAPILLPPQYGGPLPSVAELPADMRRAVEGWRATPAGQFILRLYAENRPQPAPDLIALGKHGSGRTLKDRLVNFLVSPAVLRPVFSLLRRWWPILVFGKAAFISRYDDVVDVLKRDTDFTIGPINAPKIAKIDGPFILGMDASPQYDREKAALLEAIRRDDLVAIRQFVAQSSAAIIDAIRPQRRIDVVNGLARIVPVRLLDAYFGMPGPDDPTMMRWMRDTFHYIFADLTGSATVLQDALNSVAELRKWMDAHIALRKSGQGNNGSDDVLGRLLALQNPAHPWLDDNAVRRNLGGTIIGSVDTVSKFVTLAIDQLLDRPKELAEARAFAVNGDIDAVRGYAWEAVRFNPHHPLQVRFCARDALVAPGQKRAKTILEGANTYVGNLSGMFDPDVFTSPAHFNGRRTTEYLHFGYGMHACFGKAINGVEIPELLAALLRLPNLRRAPGSEGQILYDGPFPNRLVLEFDS
jgi:cytochrome P450/glutathione S-transferase